MTSLKEPWCEWQIRCSDSPNWVCTAHMNEARAFDCGYTKDQIDEKLGKPAMDASKYQGVCEDYEVKK